MNHSIKRTLAVVVTGSALLLPLAASANATDLATGDYVGKTRAEITTTLEKQGYKINDFDQENARFELEVEKVVDKSAADPTDIDIRIDQATGKIVKVEIED